MKRLLSHSFVSTPLALALLGLLSAQPALADKRANVTGSYTQWYWCAGTADSTFSSYYGVPIPSEVGWSGNDAKVLSPMATEDGYLIKPNYWNSVLTGLPISENGGSSSKGYSSGVLCIELDTAASADHKFRVVIPPDPPTDDPAEKEKAQANANLAPWYGEWPFRWNQGLLNPPYAENASVAGGPTAYPSIWLGCAWGEPDTCTTDSSLPWYGVATGSNPGQENPNTNPRILPRQLKHITSLPSTWEIDFDPSIKTTDATQGKLHVWDAAFDIWFDKTGDPNVGKAPYPVQVRGQNDGLEIMVWMNCNHCTPESTGGGYINPIGAERERVRINGTEYIVWSGRLNNPYFGYTSSTVIPANSSADACPVFPSSRDASDGDSKTCGTNWNVVSFLATTATQSKRMDMDAKVFADYILGKGQYGSGMCSDAGVAENSLWCWTQKTDTSARQYTGGVLGCPGSPLQKSWMQDLSALRTLGVNPIPCLSEDWVLTSVQAGFETWVNAQSLTTKNFKSYALVTSSAVQSGRTADDPAPATPVVFWGAPFQVVYNGCSTVDPGNTASFQIELPEPDSNGHTTWPTDGSYQDMGSQQSNGQFVFTVPALSPMHGEATIHFQSPCGNQDVAIFIDPSGRILYSDGTTPVVGAKVTLGYSPDGSPTGPFPAVPNHNEGITPVMQPNDNTQNPMSTDKYGSYAWNVAPGYYQVRAEKEGCGSVTSAIQHVVSEPITNLDLLLPCPPPQGPAGNLSTTLTITSNWSSGGPNGTGGYCADIHGTNNTGAALDWTTVFTLTDPGTIYTSWNGIFAQSGNTLTVSGDASNNILAPGQSLNSVGFCVNRGPGSTPTKYALSVAKAGAGSGTVTSNPAGINCGGTCTASYDSGTSVTLTAAPASGSVFAGWSGASCSGTGTCTVTMNAAQSVTATFRTQPLTTRLNITRNWTTGGPHGKGGYCADVIVTNNSSAAVDWKVTFALPEPGTIYDFWNAIWSQSGSQATAEGVAWNNILPAGQSTRDVGFCANR